MAGRAALDGNIALTSGWYVRKRRRAWAMLMPHLTITSPRMRRLGKTVAGMCIGLVYAALVGLILFAGQIARQQTQLTPDDLHPTDGIVVLTGGEHRVREGLRLLHAAPVRRLLISGVYRSTSREDFRRQFDLPPVLTDCCLDIGYQAQDTSGNAAETRQWVEAWGFRRVIVVTSNYHMPRSLLMLARSLPGVQLVPHPVTSAKYQATRWWLDGASIKLLTSEYAKYLVALISA